jgi:hypothetical protein
MNEYHKDSQLFFREVAKGILEDLTKQQVIQLALNLALGCERLLKAILFDINPCYVLNDPTFKNSIQVLYSRKLIPASKGSNELLKNVNGDVITFRNSILRAQLVSPTTEEHKNILFAISDARDIIAHCELKLLNLDQIKKIIQRDFFTMLRSYAAELDIKASVYFESYNDRLSRISIAHQTDLTTKIALIIERHRAKWDVMKNDSGYIKQQEISTGIALTLGEMGSKDKGKVDCPACGQEALIFMQPIVEMDSFILEKIIIGYEIKKLRCYYCKLQVDDPSMLDQLEIKNNSISRTCLQCGIVMTNNPSGICNGCEEGQGT